MSDTDEEAVIPPPSPARKTPADLLSPPGDDKPAMLSAADGAKIMVRFLRLGTTFARRFCVDIVALESFGSCSCCCTCLPLGCLSQAKLELLDRKMNTLQASVAAYAAHE